MKMNKSEFIKKLSEQLKLSEEKCILINDILESNFVISKKSKDIIMEELISKLDVSSDEANHIYEVCVQCIKEEVKNSLKHPFKNKN